jgi:hypothetical protein
MVVVICDKGFPKMLSISGEHLTYLHGLRAVPENGFQVLLRFVLSDKDTGDARHFTAEANLWDIDAFDDVPTPEHLPNVLNEGVFPENIVREWTFSMPLVDLFTSYIGMSGTLPVEEILCEELLKRFHQEHKVRAEIETIDDLDLSAGARIRVYFERNGVDMFTFGFNVETKMAVELFALPESKAA